MEGDDRGGDGWMASPTQWTWVWASSGRWWRTGKPGVLQMGSQRVGHDWVTEQQQQNKWKDIPLIEKLLLLKCVYYSEQSADSLQSLSKFQWHFSHRTNNHIICMETQKTSNCQSNLNKARGIMLPDVYNKAVIIK